MTPSFVVALCRAVSPKRRRLTDRSVDGSTDAIDVDGSGGVTEVLVMTTVMDGFHPW